MTDEYNNMDEIYQEWDHSASSPAFDAMLHDYAQIQNVYQAAIREINSRLETLDSEFQFHYRHNPIHHIQSRIKTLPSILAKLRALGYPLSITSAKKNLRDIAGVRVICCYVADIYRVAELLLGQDDISLIEEKNYIKNPKENGYRSLHIVVDVPVFLSQGKVYIPVEIQIRTVAMDFWATLEHGIRYKASEEVPQAIVDELRKCADVIAHTDDRMERIFKALQILSDKKTDYRY